MPPDPRAFAEDAARSLLLALIDLGVPADGLRVADAGAGWPA